MLLRIAVILLILPAGCSTASRRSYEFDFRLFEPPRANAVTFWGHACCYVSIDDVGIVTDPVFEDSYSIFHKRKIPAPRYSVYSDADLVLISHAHRDHLNLETLASFPDSAIVLCPESARELLSETSRIIRVMKPGDSCTFRGAVVVAVPAYHAGGRNSLNAAPDGRALGYIIRTSGMTIYYSGDTEYFEGLRNIGDIHRPDLVLLNINGHLHSFDAVRAIAALRAKHVVPLHFGAYGGPSARKTSKWRSELLESLGNIVSPLNPGESIDLLKL